jgi:ribosomal protein S18 acetylase RimI-like enzyme
MEAWSRLWDSSGRAAFTALLPAGHRFPEPQPERVLASLSSPDLSLLVADDGELAGFTACGTSRDSDVRSDVGEVWSFFVAPERWRSGVGRTLMVAALDDLRGRGYSQATVWSFAANERANAFYEAHGFTRDGAERREQVWADILEVRYRRDLP